ncbi:MAG: ACP S-malonyltransferase [Candidatus Dormibacteraeota bacterium]|nr:ACP S-malonyltransferase [Candidatus Dormibacteraeota bacterium]
MSVMGLLPSLSGPIALLFPGQGVQKPGMGRDLYARYPVARDIFERAERVVGMPIRRLCFEGPAEELNRTEVLQPCVMTVCWAAYAVYQQEYGLTHVRVMAGHSLGEFTALAAAGAISWETALLLVKERGRIMADAARERPGGMIAIVGLDEATLEGIRRRVLPLGAVYMANRNADNQFVLSGHTDALEAVQVLALEAGARRALILTIPLPAHSPLMDAAGQAFKTVVDRLKFEMPEMPILSNATGQAMATLNDLREEVANHLLRPVDWARTMMSLRSMQVRTVVELGPGRVLASLAAKHVPGVDTWNAQELLIDSQV